MLPSILAKQLQKGIGDYIETTFPMTNAPFRGSITKMLATKDSVYHEPYVSVRLPFRVAGEMPSCFEAIHPAYLPYVHQQTAFDRLTGDDGRSTLIATGTGSGKTECFLYPILEYCYQHRGEKGIKALIIYPMNALATDQAKRIAELIGKSPELRGNVTAGMYVGGHEQNPSRMMVFDAANNDYRVITDHETMLNTPPDILMTNYKMLDYLLVRPKDAALWKDNNPDTLKYIAVDELHTFDGAQGTDLACLLRRLKSRLWTPTGYLCCIGTSATMGTKENGKDILNYAEEVFGEPFEEDAIVTEDRLSPDEFFAGSDVTDFTMPSSEQITELNTLIEQDDEEGYLRAAAHAWTDLADTDVINGEGRILLGQHLMHHSFMQAMITLIRGNYHQVSHIIDELSTNYPALKEMSNAESAINALLALISHARTGVPENLRPFLNVQVQLWMRELRRLVARVSGSDVTYSIAHDLNSQQAKQYLPVVNCRDCGATGWTSIMNERQNATIYNLETFYNLFFKADDKVAMMYPHVHENIPWGMIAGRICPDCLQVKIGQDTSTTCDNCGTDMVDIVLPNPPRTSGSKAHKQFVCPFCGSKRGLSLMGLRSATEISTELSQLFASKFNDDKKTLAFSDNVQDAAHRAGFFNARTWRFGFRNALQRYVQNGGAGQSLADFTCGFIKYWHEQMDNESFVSFFIAPNMTWMSAYEDMIEKRKFGNDARARKLMADIEKRISYEIMLEYSLTSRIGRTLEKSGCSCLAFPSDVVAEVSQIVHERVFNEIGGVDHTSYERFTQMVAGYLKIMAQNGAFDDDAFSLFLKENGNTYKLSNDLTSWMPGLQSGRNTPRFLYKPTGQVKKNYSFDTVADGKYREWIASCCDEIMIEPSTFVGISQIILEELIKNGIVVSIPATAEYTVYALDKDKVFISDQVVLLKCDTCGITHAVAEENKEAWIGAPCIRSNCAGSFEEDESTGLDYYGKLFTAGDIARKLDEELVNLFRGQLTDTCYPDPELRTLTFDVGFYISRYFSQSQKEKAEAEDDEFDENDPNLFSDEWFPALDDYSPGFTKEQWLDLLNNKKIIGPIWGGVLAAFYEAGGASTCTQIALKYNKNASGISGNCTQLAKRIYKETQCPLSIRENGKKRYWPILFQGKDAGSGIPGGYIWKLRPELYDALTEFDIMRYQWKIEGASSQEEDDETHYWWLNANPKIWSFASIGIGEAQSYTLYNENGNKRRIFQNFLDAKAGDMVIGYESNPVKQIVAIAKISAAQDGEKILFEKVEGLTSPIDYATLRECPELEHMEYFQNPQGSLFKLTKGEYEFIVDLIRDDNPLKPENKIDIYGKNDYLNEVYMTESAYESLVAVLRNKKNIILQGAPGVGKTFTARRLAWSMMGEIDDSRIEFVQFHQNYSYEDFVMGYKPTGDGFELKYGIFYRFCQKAANQPDKDFFFIIDEINRGNMSKIFGELLMLIEKDYRGTKATLAYNGLAFSVPKNLYIIGMMNTADRSLAMIDYALRRRFSFFDIEPGFDSDGFIQYQNGLNNETLNELVERVKELNKEIAMDKSLGKGFCIGHSYFCGRDVCTDEWLHAIVNYDILPMLSEYWFDDAGKLQRWENILRGVFQ